MYADLVFLLMGLSLLKASLMHSTSLKCRRLQYFLGLDSTSSKRILFWSVIGFVSL